MKQTSLPKTANFGCILFIYNTPQPFVKTDLALLQERWIVEERYERTPKRLNPIAIGRAVWRSDLVFGWFAGWHTLLPVIWARLFRKPTIIVTGGYDTANLPQIGYGSQRGGLRKWLSRTTMRHATILLTNSESARIEAITVAEASPAKIRVIHHGLELPASPQFTRPRQPLVITVGGIWRENLLRKGLQPFVEAASLLPEVTFALVGKNYDGTRHILETIASPNVQFLGYLPDDELQALYTKASVYVQASLHEGFGLSMAEAMLGGCIPVITRCGSLPEVVGDAGIYLEDNTPEQIADKVQIALRAGERQRQKSYVQIRDHFPLDKRRLELHNLVQRIFDVSG